MEELGDASVVRAETWEGFRGSQNTHLENDIEVSGAEEGGGD